MIFTLAFTLFHCVLIGTGSAIIKLLGDLKPYQVTIFLGNLTNSKINSLLVNLNSNYPAVIVGTRLAIKPLVLNPVIGLSRASTLILILQSDFNSEQIKNYLGMYTEASPTKIRPRCLVVFSSNLVPSKSIESTLEYGWGMKFLDLTVVSLNNDENFILNPFVKVYESNNTGMIFPNKLKDMKGHLLTIPYVDIVPYTYKIEVNGVAEYHGLDVDLLKFVALVMKFKINFVHSEKSNLFNSTVEALATSVLDLLPGRSPLVASHKFDSAAIGKVTTNWEYCAIVAVKKSIQIELLIEKLLQLGCQIIVAVSAANLIHCVLLVTNSESYIFENIRQLLGQPSVKDPSSVGSKVAYLIFGLFSMFYFPEIVAKLTETIVKNDEKTIANYGDILKAGLQPYVPILNLELRDQDEHLEEIKQRTIEFEEEGCLGKVILEENVICFVSKLKAKMYVDKYKKRDGSPLLKITDIEFPNLAESIFFAKNSPYVEAFDIIIQKMFEGGIFKKISTKYFNSPPEDNYGSETEDDDGDVIFLQYLDLCVVGYSASGVVFVVELLIKYLRWLKNRETAFVCV